MYINYARWDELASFPVIYYTKRQQLEFLRGGFTNMRALPYPKFKQALSLIVSNYRYLSQISLSNQHNYDNQTFIMNSSCFRSRILIIFHRNGNSYPRESFYQWAYLFLLFGMEIMFPWQHNINMDAHLGYEIFFLHSKYRYRSFFDWKWNISCNTRIVLYRKNIPQTNRGG